MRLLNTSTYELEEFLADPPPYAILSHTWGEEEVLFSDICSGSRMLKKGWKKIRGCCRLAASHGHRHVWIDTVCIDKTSSAELSEAINSMYRYYEDAILCYVYLDIDIEGSNPTREELRSSRWMYRGWTLQELLAPGEVHFYSKSWKYIGTREEHAHMLSQITNIDLSILRRSRHTVTFDLDLKSKSTAERMSWAARRETTRPEDLAYCLFGLFNVHLPPLYGEGAENAFLRLQQEIIKSTTDMSIIAWSVEKIENRYTFEAFAESPVFFAGASDIMKLKTDVEPFHLTNKGLRLKVPVFRAESTIDGRESCTAVLLNCYYWKEPRAPLGIKLYKFESNVWFREADSICTVTADELARAKVEKIYILA